MRNGVSAPSAAVQILIVDDELAIRQVLAANLRKKGYAVEDVGSGEEALERLSAGDIDIVICDINMPGLSGIDVMRKAQEAGIDTTFLLMTAFASVDTAIKAMRLGAFDYLVKPVSTEEVLHQLKQITDMRGLRSENRLLRSIVLGEQDSRCKLQSPAMREIERITTKVAATDGTVLVTGESGTGKGIIARSIHKQSMRAGAPFIPVNCGAIPENLMESEFFGHTKGAFTGADKSTKGLFAEADKGTIFLDEIGELPMALQVKLLHVIEDREFRPVGSEKVKQVDVRIVAATNRDLEKMIKAGDFREDLYFRLNIIHIAIPPLRERPEDIHSFIHFFLEHDAAQYTGGRRLSIDPEAESLLMAYGWPGNVRELENVIARALILSDGERITAADLPAQITRAVAASNAGAPSAPGGSLHEKVRSYEACLIQQTMEEMGGDRRATAERLGIGLSTLYRKIEEFKLSQSGD
jgi:two-component system, NtrC family, response regulator AtoC